MRMSNKVISVSFLPERGERDDTGTEIIFNCDNCDPRIFTSTPVNFEPTTDAPHAASSSLIVTSDSPASQANRTLPLPYTTPPKS